MKKIFFKIKPLKSRRLILALCSVFLALCIIITVTWAWLADRRTQGHDFLATTIIVEPIAYFVGSSENELMDENGYFSAVLDDPNAPNYAGKLKMSIKIKGVVKSYIRVHISDMWVTVEESAGGDKTETVIFRENDGETGITFENDWLDNRIYDNYVYYTGGNGGVVHGALDNDDHELIIPFIADIGTFYNYPNGKVYFSIRAEVVQFNRIEQFWGVSSF